MFFSESCFENLSCLGYTGTSSDLGIGTTMMPPNGIVSTSAVSGSSFNYPSINSFAHNNSKPSLFKYKSLYSSRQSKSEISENAPYSVSPLININTEEYSSPSVKSTRKIPKMPFKVLDAP